MTDMITLHAKFWEFRETMRLYWAIPDTVDAARFAVTEAAESLKTNGLWEAFVVFVASRQAQIAAADALDAVLRRNASYSRNNVRDMDERNELGDLAMMLLTAMGELPPTWQEIDGAVYQYREQKDIGAIDNIVHMVNTVHLAAYLGQDTVYLRRYALICLTMIDHYPGMDLSMTLESRMNRIYRKHHPDAGRPLPVSQGEAYQNETPATYTTLAGGLL